MSYRNVIAVLILLSAAAWWFLYEDPEAEVHSAHQELMRLLSKTQGKASSSMIVTARVLQSIFADSCEVTGDAEMIAGRYTPEEMVGTIFQVQGMFLSIDLTFRELVTAFPAADDAFTNFTAVLVGRSLMEGEGEVEVGETRAVVSRMRKVEGAWLFTEFNLAKVLEN